MEKNNQNSKDRNQRISSYPGIEMISYLRKKGKSEQDIHSYEKLGLFLRESYSSAGYSFSHNFADSVVSAILNLPKGNFLLDMADDLSKIFTKVAAVTFFTIFLIIIYSYVTQGELSGVISMDPEKLNDMRLIASVLFN